MELKEEAGVSEGCLGVSLVEKKVEKQVFEVEIVDFDG